MTGANVIVVRYDEIGLKGKNRDFFVNCLVENIKRKFAGLEEVRFRAPRGRIFIDLPAVAVEECCSRLREVPGIASFSVGVALEPDFDKIADLGIRWIEPLLAPGKTLKFCVRTQRSDKTFHKISTECDFEIGSRIMGRLGGKGLTVDIKGAEFVLEVEIGQKQTVVFHRRVPGLRGLPVGSSGEVLSLLSGGIDSPVASYLMMRRGCRVHFIFFENREFLGRGGYDKVLRLAGILNRFQGRGRLYVVPFGATQVAIRDRCRPAHRVVLYRRMMYRIAHAVARENACWALVTGESLGQVASQTLENLEAVSTVVSCNIFRPLIGMDKNEIIDRAKTIGTYGVSIEPHPDCCSVFMPPNPATRSRIPHLESDEAGFPWQSLMQEAIQKTEIVELDKSG
ncbi:MAG: tRNA uracil 4-sulfurtransferase ThiI [Nitrospinales bacterium]